MPHTHPSRSYSDKRRFGMIHVPLPFAEPFNARQYHE